MSRRYEDPGESATSWHLQQTAWAIFFAIVMLALVASIIAGFVYEDGVREACTKAGGVLADDGHGHKNCVRPLKAEELPDPTGAQD